MFSMNRRDIPPHLLKYFKPRKVYKPKDDFMIPHRVYDALMTDGWYGRMDICWHKLNPMPESVTDRPTKAHEYIFLLSKSSRYFYDADAIREENSETSQTGGVYRNEWKYAAIGHGSSTSVNRVGVPIPRNGRNRRSVWTVTTKPYKGAHFATFPPDLIEPCILAGTSAHGACSKCGAPWERVVEKIGSYKDAPSYRDHDSQSWTVGSNGNHSGHSGNMPTVKREYGGWQPTCTCAADVVPCTVLDPFAGSGTTLAVAMKHGRNAIGCELNSDYIELAHKRIGGSQPVLLEVTA